MREGTEGARRTRIPAQSRQRAGLLGSAAGIVIALGIASNAQAQLCEPCTLGVYVACARLPRIQDPGHLPPLSGAVETRAPSATGGNFCVTLYDLTQNIPAEDTNWDPIVAYHGPGGSWNATNLGTVFGLTLDGYGNIYVCHSSCYASDAVGPGGAGAIYRIDATTGAISVFATLPNQSDPRLTAPNDKPGLGNISYDCANNQFFVTDLENGKIYRLSSTNPLNASPATVVDFFDPMEPDDGLPGFAPLGERLWGVQWHAGRVYYGVWGTDFGSWPATVNNVRSVALDGSGGFVWKSDRVEVRLPSYPGASERSGPVSDISFDPSGNMVLAERTMTDPTTPGVHQARVLEHQCGSGWTLTGSFGIGVSAQTEAAGGVDVDYETYDGPSPPGSAPPGLGGSRGRIWATVDAAHSGAPYPDVIAGLQGLRPTGGSVTTSLLIDSDGNTTTSEDAYLGDVEVASKYAQGGVGVSPSVDDLAASRAWVTPTPWRGSGSLHFITARSGRSSVRLFDLHGRVVRALMDDRWTSAGRHEVALDGRDDQGAMLPSGVYLYRVATPGGLISGRFVIVR